MKTSMRNLILAGIAGVTLVSASMAIAGGFGPMGGMSGGAGPCAHKTGGDPAGAIDAHMGDLKAELKITAEQDSAWQAFTATARKQAQDMLAMRTKMQAADGSAPDRLAQRSEFMKQRVSGMDSMQAALKDLYAVLTPEQKAIADKRFGNMGGHRMSFGHRHS